MIKELSPSIVRKIWGGIKLEKMKGLPITSQGIVEPIGETLEIYEKHLPYLAKFIDTSDELSIQVHPGDEYARIHENSSGKTECWIILEANDNAGVYLGLKPYVTKDELKSALKEKKAINELLNFYPVKKGDFFYVSAGSIHAIGRNITLAEVQQNSGITYRVWDWDRLDDKGVSRELHVKKSLDVINFDPTFNTTEFFRMKKGLLQIDGLNELCSHPDFHLFHLNLKKGEVYQRELTSLTRPCSILNLEGKIKINQTDVASYCAVTIENESQLSVAAIESGSLLLIF
ncbi:MAG: class I mannose-6-phosphate isomerase [Bacteriovorax sp.]|nr:class I mannose-6-phosphate isomerase [Bacteriovorax sp.]